MGRVKPFGHRPNKNRGGKKKAVAAAVTQPTAMRKNEHRELKNLRTEGSFFARSPSQVALNRKAAKDRLEKARDNLTSVFTTGDLAALTYPKMDAQHERLLRSPSLLKKYLKTFKWDSWRSQRKNSTMSSRLHLARMRSVRGERLLPKYNWAPMRSATEAFCREAPPAIVALMRAVGRAVAQQFPESFGQRGGIKPEECALPVPVAVVVAVAVAGCVVELAEDCMSAGVCACVRVSSACVRQRPAAWL